MKIESEYIKEKIKGKYWEDKDYILDLIKIEHAVINGVQGFAHGMQFSSLKGQYPREYEEIHKELDTKGFEKVKKKEEKWEKERKRITENFEKEMKKEEDEFKQLWIKNGGAI